MVLNGYRGLTNEWKLTHLGQGNQILKCCDTWTYCLQLFLCVHFVFYNTGSGSCQYLHSHCEMADASRGPGRPPKKRCGKKKSENVPGDTLQKSQRQKGLRAKRYMEEKLSLQQCCVSCVSCVSCVTVVCCGLSSNVLYVFHPMDQYYVPHSKKTSIIEVITDME